MSDTYTSMKVRVDSASVPTIYKQLGDPSQSHSDALQSKFPIQISENFSQMQVLILRENHSNVLEQ